mgnify:CR=1 FL=1
MLYNIFLMDLKFFLTFQVIVSAGSSSIYLPKTICSVFIQCFSPHLHRECSCLLVLSHLPRIDFICPYFMISPKLLFNCYGECDGKRKKKKKKKKRQFVSSICSIDIYRDSCNSLLLLYSLIFLFSVIIFRILFVVCYILFIYPLV